MMYLVMSSCVPVRNSGGICDAFLEAMSSESTQGYGGGAVDAANCPEWDRHCELSDVIGDEDGSLS
jgi:hypothetical protein